MAEGAPSLRRARSIRTRITAISAIVIGAALVLGAVAFIGLLDRSLTAAQGTEAEQRADTIAEQLETSGSLIPPEIDDGEVQLYRDGVWVASSEHESPEPGELLPVADDPTVTDWDDGQAMVASADAEIDGAEYDVVVAIELDDRATVDGTVGLLLIIAVPLLTVVVAVLVWFVVGRALRPVDRIREEVEGIGADDLSRRVSSGAADDEITRLATTMNRMLERLDRSQQAQRRFVSDASHELRSPIASLAQHAELARAHPGATDLETLAEVVDAESGRLASLVDSLLELARAEERRMSREPVDLDDLVLAEGSRLRALGGLAVDTTGVSPVRVDGDPMLLARVLRNLGDNARRHARGAVSLSLVQEGTVAVLGVEDDGAGVPPAERDAVFDRFVRLDDARSRDIGGAGLGLAIVRSAALAHGGEVRVTDAAGGGARFEVRLPASS